MEDILEDAIDAFAHLAQLGHDNANASLLIVFEPRPRPPSRKRNLLGHVRQGNLHRPPVRVLRRFNHSYFATEPAHDLKQVTLLGRQLIKSGEQQLPRWYQPTGRE